MKKVDRRTQRNYPFYSDALKRRIVRLYRSGVDVDTLAYVLGTRPKNVYVYVKRWEHLAGTVRGAA